MKGSAQELLTSAFAQELMIRLQPLLEPVSPAVPTGESLQYDPLYDQIQQARRTEDDALPQGVWQRETQQADWSAVEHLTESAIVNRSKDLQLAIWRSEALLHLHGLPGFVAGCQLIFGLHVRFPSSMHPALASPDRDLGLEETALPLSKDDPAVERRINLIQWMNEKLAVQLKLLPITAPRTITGAASYSLADLESARLLEQSDQRKGGSTKEHHVRLFETSLAMTPMEWLLERWSELQQATKITGALDELLDSIYGEANSGLLQIKHVLESMATAIASVLPQEQLPEGEDMEATDARTATWFDVSREGQEYRADAEEHDLDFVAASEGAPRSGQASARSTRFQVRTREEAYAHLTEVAAFLSRLEPHSPVPYLLRRAIAWGGMSLEELLPELLADGAVLRDVGTLLRLPGSNCNSTK